MRNHRPTHRIGAVAFRTSRVIANGLVDVRYGALLGSHRRPGDSWLTSANSDYAVLSAIFRDRIRDSDVLVDVGCGGGRVINFWLHQGLRNRMIGIEFDPRLAARTRRRLRKYPNVQILCGDGTEVLPADGTMFYLFNPFGPAPMVRFADRLSRLAAATEGRLTVVYYNCKHLEAFGDDGGWAIQRITLDAPEYAPPSPLAILTPRHPAR